MSAPRVGAKVESMKDLKKSLKSRGGDWITQVKADESLTVRFLTEVDEWYLYTEYFDPIRNTMVVLAEDERAPQTVKPSRRYLAAAVSREEDRVISLKLPKTLANTLVGRADKFGTIMDRDYELVREGKGLDTRYDVYNEGPSDFNFGKYDQPDLEAMLIREWEKSHGIDDDHDDDDDDDDVQQSRPGRGRAGVAKGDDSFMADDQFSHSESDLKKMSVDELRDLAQSLGIKASKARKTDLIELIMESQ